jgi:hypothetical protein
MHHAATDASARHIDFVSVDSDARRRKDIAITGNFVLPQDCIV